MVGQPTIVVHMGQAKTLLAALTSAGYALVPVKELEGLRVRSTVAVGLLHAGQDIHEHLEMMDDGYYACRWEPVKRLENTLAESSALLAALETSEVTK